MEKGKYEWLIDALVVVRVIALALAAIVGAILERDVGVLPGAPAPASGSSSKLLADKAECPPRP